MDFKDKFLFWTAGILCLSLFLYMISGILLPFVVALIASYFLDPATHKLQTMGLSRTASTFAITLSFFLLVILAGLLVTPLLYDQAVSLLQKIPDFLTMAKEKWIPSFSSAIQKIDPHAVEKATESISQASSVVLGILGKIMNNVWDSGLAVVNLLSLLFITPIVTFYILRDWETMLQKIDGWLPPEHAPIIRKQAAEIDRTLSGYIRGQTNVCLLLALFYAMGLTLVGLESGFVIGLATGILSFIPYVGLLFGFAVGMVVAVMQFGNIVDISLVAAVFIAGQVIEGNFITPKLVGDKVGLHPVWIIFGMMAGASMFGFLGILLAIPVTAIIGVLTRFALDIYLHSSFYKTGKKKSAKA